MSVRNDELASLIASAAFAALVLALVAAPAQAQEVLRDEEEDVPAAREPGLRLQAPSLLGGERQQPSEELRLPPPTGTVGNTAADEALDEALEDDDWWDEAGDEADTPAADLAAEDEAWLRGELDGETAVDDADAEHGEEAHAHGEDGELAHGEHDEHGEHGAGADHEGGHEEHFDPVQFGVTVINFLVWLAIVVWLLRKPLTTHLETRRRDVEEGLVEAKRLKQEATQKYEEYAERLEHLDEELNKLRKEMVQAGEAERDRIIEDAEERAARMRRDASFVIQQQMKQLRADLTQEAIEAAVDAAEKMLVEQIAGADQQTLADAYLRDLGESIREEDEVRA